ncbi:hypothetical protein HYU22_05065 [Candidatus Woesearchaeota archaeon]|nr:hypothetical protein [Candidatus Woesearchaeota archaeon]
MKLGIIKNEDRAVYQALEQVYKALGYEVEIFSQKEFQPKYVSERSLDAILVEENNDSDMSASFAIAVKRNVPEKTIVGYFYFKPLSKERLTELEEHGVRNFAFLDLDKEKFTKWLGGS